MSINFPDTPTVNDTYTDDNGQVWNCKAVSPNRWAKSTSMSRGGVVGYDKATDTTVKTDTTNIPKDDTIPQITEGTEAVNITYTPKYNNSVLVINATAHISSVANQVHAIALFKDSDANAISMNRQYNNDTAYYSYGGVDLSYKFQCTTTDAITFSLRFGGHTGTTYTNSDTAGANVYGSLLDSSIEVTEINVNQLADKVAQSGDVLQVVSAQIDTGTNYDITVGNEIIGMDIAPKSANSSFIIEGNVCINCDGTGENVEFKYKINTVAQTPQIARQYSSSVNASTIQQMPWYAKYANTDLTTKTVSIYASGVTGTPRHYLATTVTLLKITEIQN